MSPTRYKASGSRSGPRLFVRRIVALVLVAACIAGLALGARVALEEIRDSGPATTVVPPPPPKPLRILVPVLVGLTDWAVAAMPEIEGARSRFGSPGSES